MILTEEDDEFARIERENKMRYGQPYHFAPQREWVGLTEDEAFACQGRDYFETYKAIEAKLREKNR
jgi:hypothetical protein